MIEITGVESKIEGLIQVLNENGDRILEISRTGRMVMRRGQHTSRVIEAMRVPGLETPDELKVEEETGASDVLMADETGF
jgi:acetolactate synthase-1/3 small subunit